MFGANNYAKIWEVKEVKDKYTVCSVSTSKKDKQTGRYVQDFSDGKVRFVGKAHRQKPQAEQNIKIIDCGVSVIYNKEKNKTYTNFVIFDYELSNPDSTVSPIEEDLPFIFE